MNLKKILLKMSVTAALVGSSIVLSSQVEAEILPVKMVDKADDLLILRSKCLPVTSFDEPLAHQMQDLQDTLNAQEGGAGIAANQVGYSFRAVVLFKDVKGKLIYKGDSVPDPKKDPRLKGEPLELINPEILETRGEQLIVEGCFSIPSLVILSRPKFIKVRAYDRNGEEFTLELNEEMTEMAKSDTTELPMLLFSTHLIVHECEHLDGVLCTDKALIRDIPKDTKIEDLMALIKRARTFQS